jgi:hypothetical protein
MVQLDRCLSYPPEPHRLALDMSEIGNNAALLAAHRGAPALARTLCERQIAWELRFSARAGDSDLAAHAVQPWVNLGRLDVLAGCWEKAVDRFRQLREGFAKGFIEVGGTAIGCTGWASHEMGGEFASFVHYVFVVDTLRAYLLSNRYREAMDFADVQRNDPHLALVVEEAHVAALHGSGRVDEACGRAAAAGRNARGWDRVAFRIRTAETLAGVGDAAGAESVLSRLADLVLGLSPEKHAEFQTLVVTSRIATACCELGRTTEAAAVARAVYFGARRASDEVFEIEALRVLSVAASPNEQENWQNLLDRALAGTGYAKYHGGASEPDPLLDGMFQAVLTALAD